METPGGGDESTGKKDDLADTTPSKNTKTSGTTVSVSVSSITTGSSKVSTVANSGINYVIPKNKLSGALVPVSRSNTKWEPLDTKKDEEKLPSRKTKWGPDLTLDPVVKRGRALALQTRVEQIAVQLESGNLDMDDNEATRSPSPPPMYDNLGHRMNTREARKREQLDLERREAIGECMKLNPSYKPPSGYRPVPKEAKLFIPVKEHPGYNFIGLILGPRGNTQKRMEQETGAKITIRGKGSVKEGKQLPVRHGKDDGSFEDLHVHISADSYEKVDAAIAIIEPLLTPVDEHRNVHIMKQLRELAEINGTVREFTRVCTLCGEIGHKEWNCPKDKLQTFQANVTCRLCGDCSHPTFDCPLKATGECETIDKEYLNFLDEIGMRSSELSADVSVSQVMPSTSSSTPGPPRPPVDAPRFPFPFPPTPQTLSFFQFLLPRLFHPTHGLFRGSRPFSGPGLAMMARMFSTMRGRFPFPGPFPPGFRPDIRPPAPQAGQNASTSGLYTEAKVEEAQNQTTPSAAEHSKPENNIAEASSLASKGTMPNMGTVPLPSSIQSPKPLPPELTSPTAWPPVQAHPVPPVSSVPPTRSVIPSVRPVFPSIRPAFPSICHPSNMAHVIPEVPTASSSWDQSNSYSQPPQPYGQYSSSAFSPSPRPYSALAPPPSSIDVSFTPGSHASTTFHHRSSAAFIPTSYSMNPPIQPSFTPVYSQSSPNQFSESINSYRYSNRDVEHHPSHGGHYNFSYQPQGHNLQFRHHNNSAASNIRPPEPYFLFPARPVQPDFRVPVPNVTGPPFPNGHGFRGPPPQAGFNPYHSWSAYQ